MDEVTDQPPDAEPKATHPLYDDELDWLLAMPPAEMTVDEFLALKARYKARYETRGIVNQKSVLLDLAAPLLAVAAIYSKAFLETLAKHNAEALMDAVHSRIRIRKSIAREVLVGPEDGSAAILVITSDTPDEARLALLDLDVTAEEVRGKTLRWDSEAMAWRPDSAED
jgi:hypothetical protein